MRLHPEVAHDVALMVVKIACNQWSEKDTYTHDVAEKIIRANCYADTVAWINYITGTWRVI